MSNYCSAFRKLRILLEKTSINTTCTYIRVNCRYPDYWYNDVTADPSLWSMAAVHSNKIVGICIAEIKRLNNANVEVRKLLSIIFLHAYRSCMHVISYMHVEKWYERKVNSSGDPSTSH